MCFESSRVDSKQNPQKVFGTLFFNKIEHGFFMWINMKMGYHQKEIPTPLSQLLNAMTFGNMLRTLVFLNLCDRGTVYPYRYKSFPRLLVRIADYQFGSREKRTKNCPLLMPIHTEGGTSCVYSLIFCMLFSPFFTLPLLHNIFSHFALLAFKHICKGLFCQIHVYTHNVIIIIIYSQST